MLVAAPVKDGSALNLVMGINDHLYDPGEHRLVTAASCTTNCLAPVVKVVHEAIGIRHGQITTIHDPTNTNLVVDGVHKDLRRARSAIALVAADDDGFGHRDRADLSRTRRQARRSCRARAGAQCLADRLRLRDGARDQRRGDQRPVRHRRFRPARGILGFEARPLVSIDFAGDTRSSIIDGPSTLVTDGTLLKIYAWYDNEMAFPDRIGRSRLQDA